MKFNPENIKNYEFNKAFRGFDVDEVEVFLEKIADELDGLHKENDRLKSELEEKTGLINEYRKIEKNLQNALISAQESTNRAADSAKKQSNLIMKEAELKARQTVELAKNEAAEVRNSVYRLREERDIIIAKLKAIVETQEKLITRDYEDKKLHSGRVEPEPIRENSDGINVENILEKLL